MKRTTVAILAAVLLTSGLLGGCIGAIRGAITGSTNLETREYDFSDFTQVEVGGAFEVEIAQSDSYSVKITADDNLFNHIVVSKKGTKLTIRLKWGYSYLSTAQRAMITMPDLYDLRLSGATRGSVQGFSSSHNFTLGLSGASRLDMADMSVGDINLDASGASRISGSIETGDCNFSLSGASRVELAGSGNDADIDASGASKFELADFPINNANVRLSGASSSTINLSGKLDANLSGASTLKYSGNPTLGSIKTSGGSKVSEK